MATNLNWELYRTFLAVLTEGSLSGAARALGITQMQDGAKGSYPWPNAVQLLS